MDWEHPANHDLLLVSQSTVTGVLYICRPDLVGFVHGLPLVVSELKKPGVPARPAFDEKLTSYKHPQSVIPALFVFNARPIASNGTEALQRQPTHCVWMKSVSMRLGGSKSWSRSIEV